MDERDALLRAVCDNPDDDTPRLVFADWLDEHGEPERAEFIRVQIELTKQSGPMRRVKLAVREAALLKQHQSEWTESLREFEGNRTGGRYVFRRGFVEAMSSDGEILLDDGNRLFALAPIRELRLADEEEYAGLAQRKWLLRLHTLDLTGSGLSRHFDPSPLLRSKNLASLTTLRLCGEDDNGHLDIPGIRALVSTDHLGKLRELDLTHNWFGDEGLLELLNATKLVSLTGLELEGIGIEDWGVEHLSSAPMCRRLKVLNLASNRIGDRGARFLLNSPFLDGLELLDLRGNQAVVDEDEDESPTPISRDTQESLRAKYGTGALI